MDTGQEIMECNTYRRKIIDERDFRLCKMSHVRATDIQCIFAPPVDLARSCGPHDIVKEYVSVAKSTLLFSH